MKLRFWPLIPLTLLILFSTAGLSPAWSKPLFKIGLIMADGPEAEYQKQIVREINILLDSRARVEYVKRRLGEGTEPARQVIDGLMADPSVDCVIGIDLQPSAHLIELKNYAKPTIAATILDRHLQGLALTPEGTSGIHNFNYVLSPFDIEKDLATFRTLYGYKHLAVLLSEGDDFMFHTLFSYFGRAVENVSPQAKLSIVEIDPDDIEGSLEQIPPTADAAYILPLFPGYSPEKEKALIDGVNGKKLPSFALAGEEHVRMGAMAAVAPARNVNAMIRRIAINVLEIMDGSDASILPVTVSPYADNFVVNVETLRKIDYHPAFKTLEKARLLNLNKLRQGPEISLKGVIFEALERNLDLLMEKADTQIQAETAGAAASALMPQVNLSSSITHVDENQVKIAGTVPARTTWTAKGTLSQTLFSDDILANTAIQKILLESQKYQEQAVLMDTVVSAAQAYITLLSARSSQAIQNNNLKVTRANLDLARNKAAVGSVDASEVNRWESEEATNQIQLNDAYRDVELARMSLNQLLDRPLSRNFSPLDIQPDSSIEMMVTDPEVYRLVGNFKQLEAFSNFLIQEADINLPELKQIAQAIKSRQRQLLNRERARYLPDLSFTGQLDHILSQHDAVRKTPSELDHPWSVALTATWPLYTGGLRRRELAQSRIELNRTRLQERHLRNQLHLSVRSRLEASAVSAREIDLAKRALASARRSFGIIQAGYAEGRNSVTDLVDAQNAMVSSERQAALSRYQFVIDFISLERAVGRFYFLESQGGKKIFLQRLRTYMGRGA